MNERGAGKKYFLLWSYSFVLLLLSASVKGQAPVASFLADVTIGCAPLSVNFTNTSTGANSYSWNLGNSNNSAIANPSAIYLTPGSYTVTLTATNTVNGLQSTASQTITVANDPVSNFTVTPTSGCEDYNNICFTNTSAFAATYLWDFGDGNTSNTVNPCHTYLASGVYTVKLIAFSTYGCSDVETKSSIITINPKPVTNFSSNIQSTCNVGDVFSFTANAPGSNSWSWNFGDFTTSTLQNPSHTYAVSGTYSVSLIATNSFGCADTITKINYINIGASLVPSFTLNDSGGCAPFTVNFDCTVPNALTWNWNFGNGNTSTIKTPSNTYTASGNYNITLSVTTQSGCNGTVTIPALVVVDPLPVPSFTVTQDTGCSPFTPQINNTSTGAATYSWSTTPLLQTSTQTNPTFTYTNAGPYHLTLTAYSPNGCPKSTTVNNSILVQDPVATFSGTPLTGCPGMTTNFTHSGSPTNIVTWLWSFGDGTFSGLQNPSHTYSAVGNYNVYLIVTNAFGCKDTVYKGNYVKIYPNPIPYTTDTMKVCQTIAQTFTDPTSGSNSWLWNFGDGTTSTIRNPSHIYNTPGTYTVTLFTTMAGGCSQSFSPFHIVQVIPYVPKPVVINYISRCKPYTIGFSNAALTVTNYLWNFGDGTTSTLAAPVHVYATAGTYTVRLTLTVGSGCQDIITNTIIVGNTNPMKVDSMNICIGVASQFTLLNPTAFVSQKWDFGDATSSFLQNPSHTYANGGSYTAILMTTDTSGCKDTFQLGPIIVNKPLASFTATGPTVGCGTLTVQFQNNSTGAATYLWNFGNITTSTLPNPSCTYAVAGAYTVSLTATINGCSNTQTISNYLNVISPQCNFSFTTNSQCIPLVANYTDLSPGAVSWLWDFGDGTTSTLQNPVHTFSAAPSGPVVLTITDQYGCTASLSQTNVSYYAASGIVSAPTGCTPLTVSFTDQSTSSVSLLWQFGDGTTSTLANPSHTYFNDGTYNVTLTATFPGGCTDSVVYPALITASTPIADFMAPAVSGCSPVNISFNNFSTDAVSYIWDFGDGSTSTNVNPNHIYNIPGYYDVSLIAVSALGCNDTMLKVAYIAVPGVYSSFTISAATGCDTLPALFIDSSINAVTWSWSFGDGNTSNLQNPTHTYQDTGSYTVTLITQDTLGCTSVFTYPLPIQIYQSPTAQATTNDTAGCSAYLVSFSNQSMLANSYTWDFGNGVTSAAVNPAYSYTVAGTYFPSLIAITTAGCRDTFYLPSINVKQTPVPLFSTSADTACEPASIAFTDQSNMLSGSSYNWAFGNGQFSTLQNPSVLYAANNYSISLIVTNSNGCSDTIMHSVVINPTPVPSASTADMEGCQPYSVQFANASTGATAYTWQLETGISSNATNPNYIYSTPGSYYPTVIATNNFGCADTFNFTNPIIVHAVPVVSFTPSAYTVCNPDSITFTNNSSNLENPFYNWNYGNGLTGTDSTGGIMYTDSGIFSVTLYVTNTFGCNDSNSLFITVNASPIASGATNDTLGCSAYTANFTNSTLYAGSYYWDFGDGNTSTAFQPSHSYLSGGIYQPVLIASNNYGCIDTTVLANTINVMQTPRATIAADDSATCFGTPITFINNSSNLLTPTYLWNFSFINSAASTPVITFPGPGFYDVSLLVTNNNGCADSTNIPSFIEIYDTIPPGPSILLSVSVVNDNSVDITWQNNTDTDLGAYEIYRYDVLSASFLPIYTDNNPKDFSVSPSTTFRDTGLDTKNNTYTYLVKTTDRCGYALPISSSLDHTTMNVTAVQSGTNIGISWTPYLGCSVSTYDITRTEVATGMVQFIASVPSSTLNYLDTTLTCPFAYAYLITANALCGNAYISLSDTSAAIPQNQLANQYVDIVRSTVFNNTNILTEWLPPVLLPSRVKNYRILRSIDNINYSPLAIVSSFASSYTDNNVKINDQNYYYRIEVINDCDLSGPQGTEGSSILLQGEWRNYRTKLNWTKYEWWSNDIDHHTIQKLNEFGVWVDYMDVVGNTFDVEFGE